MQFSKIKLEDLVVKEQLIVIPSLTGLRISKKPRGPELQLPEEVEIDKDTAWAVGFFVAEGNKVFYGIGISNTEVELVKRFRKIVEEKFLIDNKSWRGYIKSSKPDFEQNREKWEKELGIRVLMQFTKLATKDAIELRINNVTLSIIFNKFIKKSLEEIEKNRSLTLSFLDGYEAGDGSVVQRKGYLYGIVITVKDEQVNHYLLKFFQNLYEFRIAVRKSKGCYEIQIRGVRNLTKIILDEHFRSYTKQWKKLVKSYAKKQYTRSHRNYWLALKSGHLSIEQIAARSNRTHWSVRDALIIDTKENLVIPYKKHIVGRKAPYFKFYSLSTDGLKLIQIIEEVERDGA